MRCRRGSRCKGKIFKPVCNVIIFIMEDNRWFTKKIFDSIMVLGSYRNLINNYREQMNEQKEPLFDGRRF